MEGLHDQGSSLGAWYNSSKIPHLQFLMHDEYSLSSEDWSKIASRLQLDLGRMADDDSRVDDSIRIFVKAESSA